MERKKIRNICLCFFLLCGLLFFSGTDVQAKPSESLVLDIYYTRYDGDYEDWSLWLWTDDTEGREYAFSEESGEGGAGIRIVLENIDENTRIGTLMKYKDWEKKDVEHDRYLDLSKAENGMLSVYFLQEEEEIFYAGQNTHTGQRILRAQYDDVNMVSFTLYAPGLSKEQAEELAVSIEEEEGGIYPLEELELAWEGNFIKGKGMLKEAAKLSGCNYLQVEDIEKKAIEAGAVFSSQAFEEAYTYEGDDLGAVYTKEATAFRVWAPTASKVEVRLYENGNGDGFLEAYPMERDEKGTWYRKLPGDYSGMYYTYLVTVLGETREAVDPYARACGVNGMRGMVIDLEKTNPQGFAEEKKPPLASFRDIILYEMSIRDYTIDEHSGVKEKGKYLGLTEEGTVNSEGQATALDYLGSLGVTHVHLMPCQDSGEVDEEHPEDSYNWGYMTQNFNVPEGAYSTDPYQGQVRVKEYKQMVQSLHKKGLRVVMDVVYNHTSEAGESNFNKIVPGYYYRIGEDGSYSNGSACGNEVATERAMARKFIVDSVVYWAKEYHVDGFRFDLMGLIDIDTMKLIRKELDKIDETIYLYGEGWTGGDSISTGVMAEAENVAEMPEIAVFSNVFRRGVQKYVSGIFEEELTKNSVLFGVVAATRQEITKETMGSWTKEPAQCINYASCHDGYTLWDLIRQNCSGETEEMWRKRNKLSAAIVMTVQGVPFIQSGEEMLRSKVAEGEPEKIYGNSYNAGDDVNSIKWDSISEYPDMVSYYKGLMAFRKEHKGLSYETAEEIEKNMKFLDGLPEQVIAYTVTEPENLILENEICMIYNPNKEQASLMLPKGRWKVYIDGERAGVEELASLNGKTQIQIPGIEPLVLVRTYIKVEVFYAGIGIGALAAIFAGIKIRRSRRKKHERSSNHQ
ncbi:MAG: type I pullulanase [Roseburia sp.]|nr:type I pullulanase [Roseburia sp.]MCM1277916.1 type I pullulanase [Robinsoniella sp.]